MDFIKNMSFRHYLMLTVILAGVICFGYALIDKQYLVGISSFLTVFGPGFIWYLDDKESKRRQEQFMKLKDRVKSIEPNYVENPEWLWVVLDAAEHILFGIKQDGSIDWSIGVPMPIKKEIDELKKEIIELKNKDNNMSSSSALHT